MNGMKTKFGDNRSMVPGYYDYPNPYVNAPSCHVNLLELSRYARTVGKKLEELTQEEIQRFSI